MMMFRKTIIEWLERRILCNAGDLDTTFRSTGRTATVDTGGGLHDLAVASDGSIYFASGTDHLVLWKYKPDGTIDTTFGSSGSVSNIPVSGGNQFGASSVALQSDGKVILAGETFVDGTGTGTSAVARYTSSGQPDTTFGMNGSTTISFAGHIQCQLRAVAIQSDDKIVVTGYVNSDAFVARLTASGAPDTTFDGDGFKSITFPHLPGNYSFAADNPNAVALRSDGKIIVAGGLREISKSDPFGTLVESGLELMRLNPVGSLDTTFDGDGLLITDESLNSGLDGSDLAIQSDGKVVVGSAKGLLLRYNTDGSPDTTFDQDGRASLSQTTTGFTKIGLETNGEILAAAAFGSPLQSTVLQRFNANGSLDTTFGTSGQSTIDWHAVRTTTVSVKLNALEIQPDGRVLVGVDRKTSSSTGFGMARYLTGVAGPQITGSIFSDTNGNGIQDASETAYTGAINAYLDLNNDGAFDANEPTSATSAFGTFTFTNLVPRQYTVRLKDFTTAGARQTFPSVGAGETVNLLPGQNATTSAFGVEPWPAIVAPQYQVNQTPRPVITFQMTNDFPQGIDPSAFTLQDVDHAQVVNFTLTGGVVAGDYVTYTVTPVASSGPGGSLPDGNYRLNAPASAVVDPAGYHLPSDFQFDFFVLQADGDRSGTVDIVDFNILAANFGKSGISFTGGNYDASNDGQVTLVDFNILASVFGKSVRAPIQSQSVATFNAPSISVTSQPLTVDLLGEINLRSPTDTL